MAAYVDGVAVFAGTEERAKQEITYVRQKLDEAGLTCSDKAEEEMTLDEKHTFVGLYFDRESGRVKVSAQRLWRIRFAILFAFQRGRMSPRQLERLLGHITWAALVRREVLSILSACYKFADLEGTSPVRLWPSVARELFWISSLLPLWFSDTQREWSSDLYATDAEGANAVDAGGYGVCRRFIGPDEAASI